ncbi:16S rRNA (guanine(527)-N(7))-methyltransferase RsmG [Aquirufa sp. LEOWEIH-7C]|uniref:Ribosomal RNA small subunit methyltransferase G n=2 Tax=Aquirufa regiilacus TaxID=3024868 RepID=A0ABU3TTF5_9BACT|nr:MULTISPECIES: 16S rRNA (guanine(527)-N(7))-methyltransferase RsmG [unclassified Aquirufa]MDT8886082.1 16S rRNA (guanine(527)-N(7))-methyltransferase RsmG [Aquirufa sp. LEPPI-3A]MDU0809143.1 16S rRNA (guanine(527)-N(7))-methyltransferase RsmG [Aquirufa sp. LEOWEIH-7C]
MNAALIKKYFPEITEEQEAQFDQLLPLYNEWNEKINVVSRKDIENLMLHHVLHSLAIAKFLPFRPGTEVLDVGTGGGFPGIPLAILFPETQFLLVDSIGKKIKVVEGVAEALGLSNVQAKHMRAEDVDQDFEFIISRAVTRLTPFYYWVKNKISPNHFHTQRNGLLLLKGGELTEEIAELGKKAKVTDLTSYFKEDFFETKKLVYVPM